MHLSKPPVYLNLWRIHLPLPGWVSIIQRLSGAGLFLFLPLLVYLFHLSLTRSGYAQLLHWRQSWPVKLAMLLMLWFYLQHFLAGMRFLLLDIHVGASWRWARHLSAGTLLTSALLSLIIAGLWR